MSSPMVVRTIHSELPVFARHHGVERPAAGDTLTVGDPRGQPGGFGVVHQLKTIAGSPPSKAMLAKRFHAAARDAATLERIAAGVARLHRVLENRPHRDWLDALLALPVSIFTASTGTEEHLVLLMLDLLPLGYEPAPLDRDDGLADYLQRDDGERLDLAFRYAERAALLEEIQFLHADQNPENLMFSFARLDVQLIDFDAGTIVEDGSERPLTPGKPDGYMPPEVKGEGLDLPDPDRYVTAAERWSIGSLVGAIVFGIHPGFFLRSISMTVLEEYARQGTRWPDVDPGGQLFGDPANRPVYEEFRHALQSMPRRLIETFGDMFAAGVQAERRPTAMHWKEAIAACRKPPVIEWVKVTPCFAVEGSEVVVEWAVQDAERVHSPQLGELASSGSATFVIVQPMKFSFTATNRYGKTQATSPLVRMVPLPRLDYIPIPEFPGFAFHTAIPMPPYPMQHHNPFPVEPPVEMMFPANLTAQTVRGPRIPPLPRIPDMYAVELEPHWSAPWAWRMSERDWLRR